MIADIGDWKMSNTKKANINKTNTRKTSTRKATIKNTDIKQIKTRKANIKEVNNKKIHEWITEITEISLLLIAFGVVAEILFGSVVPIGSRIMTNLIGSLGTLGESGFAGLVALGIVVYIFRRAKVFA
jgi:hypothetical protein